MKRWFVFCGFMLSAAVAYAAPIEVEAPIKEAGTAVTLSVSTSAWTKAPTSQTSGRMGVYVDAPAANTANVVGHFGNCTSTALAITVRPLEIVKGEQASYFPIREDVCLWLLSLHTGAENVHYQEVKK